ncbi:tripartite tricarboxylate transporter substrate binding protein [Flaviflagellibacter deserti]|uniref:Tripartite tricarboxylate transporter substrate binding protein n=1 Tax=Flaviflagellibacter deserti TaxID=2267266 RepID=A0ABV9Z307_9HYPH
MLVKHTNALARSLFAATLGLACAAALPALAQDKIAYPHKVVTLVTHSSPGGGSDVFLRDMTKYLKQVIDADFVVENVSGGSGAKAMAHMAKQKPDGSVFYATTPTYIYTSHMAELSANYTALEPLANFFYDPEVIYTRADAPFKTLKDVLDKAKAGRSAWGAANPGSLERITLEQMKKITGVNAAVVTSEGGGETMINVLNGTLDIAIGEVQELRSQLEGKQVRVLAVLSEAPLALLPGVPTAKDSGIDLAVRKFRGLAGPKGLPPEITKAWDQAIPKLLADPKYKADYEAANLVPAFIAHDDYVKFVDHFAMEQKTLLTEVGVVKKK